MTSLAAVGGLAVLVSVLALQVLLLRRTRRTTGRRSSASRLHHAGRATARAGASAGTATAKAGVSAGRAALRAVGALLRAVVNALATVVGAVAFYLVLTPLGLGARALGLSVLPPGDWHPHRPPPPDHHAVTRAHGGAPSRRPGARSGRPSWQVAVVLVAVGALGATLLPRLWDREPDGLEAPEQLQGETYNPFDAPALADADWKNEAGTEFAEASAGQTYTSYVGNSLRDYVGRHVNIADRERRSYRPAAGLGADPVEVWFFGGSTMFGFSAQRDVHTIPSEVVRLAEADGVAVEAHNFGAPGYVNMQETALFGQLLAAGGRPDLVVFYDGINDGAVPLQQALGGIGVPGEPSEIVAFAYRRLLAGQLTGTDLPPTPLAPTVSISRPPQAEELVEAVLQVYRRGLELGRALGEAYDVPVVHFWQPTLFTRQPLAAGEQEVVDELGLDEFQFDATARLFRAMASRLPAGAIDLSDAFDGATEPILTDQAHHNELGARLVAEAMYDELVPQLTGGGTG